MFIIWASTMVRLREAQPCCCRGGLSRLRRRRLVHSASWCLAQGFSLYLDLLAAMGTEVDLDQFCAAGKLNCNQFVSASMRGACFVNSPFLAVIPSGMKSSRSCVGQFVGGCMVFV